jgi:hypothetical protein
MNETEHVEPEQRPYRVGPMNARLFGLKNKKTTPVWIQRGRRSLNQKLFSGKSETFRTSSGGAAEAEFVTSVQTSDPHPST